MNDMNLSQESIRKRISQNRQKLGDLMAQVQGINNVIRVLQAMCRHPDFLEEVCVDCGRTKNN